MRVQAGTGGYPVPGYCAFTKARPKRRFAQSWERQSRPHYVWLSPRPCTEPILPTLPSVGQAFGRDLGAASGPDWRIRCDGTSTMVLFGRSRVVERARRDVGDGSSGAHGSVMQKIHMLMCVWCFVVAVSQWLCQFVVVPFVLFRAMLLCRHSCFLSRSLSQPGSLWCLCVLDRQRYR